MSTVLSGGSGLWELFGHLFFASWCLPESVRVGLRVVGLSQRSVSVGVADLWHRELPLTVSLAWRDRGRRWTAGLARGVSAGGRS